ncbi:hypothetical protein [Auritidibacter ignavus]|uniref:hypothetical protein n=1 Tax=Auritidibacter ignavus TaxID=678932 RepID=UPI000F01F822|nr:hypothetical protein [Auritidibacter ignavus]NIH71499.1 hypothetical protein [Auritidibacter ignavus]RMX22494.1 hypothetical protein DYI20_09315 [Auritidibacter ignavus]
MSPRHHAIPDLTDEFDETDEYVLPDYRDLEAIPELSASQLEQMVSVATNPETPEPEGELVPNDAVSEQDLDADEDLVYDDLDGTDEYSDDLVDDDPGSARPDNADIANSDDLWCEEDASDPQL